MPAMTTATPDTTTPVEIYTHFPSDPTRTAAVLSVELRGLEPLTPGVANSGQGGRPGLSE